MSDSPLAMHSLREGLQPFISMVPEHSPVPGMTHMSKNDGRLQTWFDHRSLSWMIGLPKMTWVFRIKYFHAHSTDKTLKALGG